MLCIVYVKYFNLHLKTGIICAQLKALRPCSGWVKQTRTSVGHIYHASGILGHLACKHDAVYIVDNSRQKIVFLVLLTSIFIFIERPNAPQQSPLQNCFQFTSFGWGVGAEPKGCKKTIPTQRQAASPCCCLAEETGGSAAAPPDDAAVFFPPLRQWHVHLSSTLNMKKKKDLLL